LPLVAAGGVDGPAAVRRLLDAGAERVAVGTLLLRTDEAGTSAAHRAALADPAFAETAITRVFTGRPARALRNGFIDRHERHAIDAYPAVHHLTRGLRQAAAAAGDTDRLHLWAGTGWRRARTGRAGDVISWLAGRGE
jgi:NAD(P)H-dependent flavin oxidoreductase YrpB (nitropropane dioxygenase family)